MNMIKRLFREDYKTDITFRNLAIIYAKNLKHMIGEVNDIKKDNKYDMKLKKKYIYFKDPNIDISYLIGSAKNEPQVRFEQISGENVLVLNILPQGMIDDFTFKKYDKKIVYKHIELRENILVNAFTKYIDRTRAKDINLYKPKIFSVRYTPRRSEQEEYNPFFQQFIDLFWMDVNVILKGTDEELGSQVEKFNNFIGSDYADFIDKSFKRKTPIFMPQFKKYFDGLDREYKRKMLKRLYPHYINGQKIINGEELE